MGLLEEIEFRNDPVKNLLTSLEIDQPNLLDKLVTQELSIDYDIYYSQLLNNEFKFKFECSSHPHCSFYAHSLELGEDETNYWFRTSRDKETVLFNGRVNRSYPIFGSLRGYFDNPRDGHKMGVIVKDGRVEKVLDHKGYLINIADMHNILKQ